MPLPTPSATPALVLALGFLCIPADSAAHDGSGDGPLRVRMVSNVTYGMGLRCPSDAAATGNRSACTAMPLNLDIYVPDPAPGSGRGYTTEAGLRAAYVLMHGGGNSGGVREQVPFQGAAKLFAGKGLVAFNIDYRLKGDHGAYPPLPGRAGPALEWTPRWPSSYPAVRDLKAAVRFVRSVAEQYGIDPEKIAVSGGSAGATNSFAAGVVFEDDYKTELSAAEDPTLASTHLNFSSAVQCVVTHWSSDLEATMPQLLDPANRSRYSASNAPVLEFHGNKDTTIPIAHAYAEQAAYNRTGVDYRLVVLDGCAHAAWMWGCGSACSGMTTYCPKMDELAWPFLVQHLGLRQ